MAEAALEELYESVREANEGFEESMDDMFFSWEKSGNTYTREIIVYSTLWGDEYEDVSVKGYEEYRMQPFSLETDLSGERLERLSSLAIHVLIGEAQKEVQTQSEEIFGNGEEGESGEYGEHIGDAPVVVDKPDVEKGKEKLYKDGGSGELGRMMRDYIYYQMKEQQGWMYASKAPWEKPMWDDRGSFMEAPTLRSVANIGMTIVGVIAAPITGGASLLASIALNTAVSVADDLVFGMLDVAAGYKGIEQAGLDFGKAALTTAATSAINVGFGGYAPVDAMTPSTFTGLMGAVGDLGLTGMSGVLMNTAVGGLQSLTSMTVTSAINSVHLDENGKLGFSGNAFESQFKGGLGGLVGGMTSSFVSGTLGQMNLFDGNSLGLSDKIFNTDGIKGFNSFVGGIASQGVQYAMGGDFTLNVLNFGMFGIEDANKNLVSQGLFELRFGRDGFSAGVGMGGMDASYGAIASVINGAAAWGTNTKIQNYIKNGGLNAAIALRAQYGYGDKTQRDQLFDILNGGTSLVLGSEGEYGAQTITGSDGRTVYLEGYREGMSAGEQFALAVLLGHEAYRDGVNNGIMGQMLETQGAARGHTEMLVRMLKEGQGVAMNDNLMADLQAYFQGDNAFNQYVNTNYDSSADYWKLMSNGDLVKDTDGWLKDENGQYINADGTRTATRQENTIGAQGIETGLLNILYGGTSNKAYNSFSDSQIENVQALLVYSGIVHTGEEGLRDRYWTTGNDNKSISFTAMMNGGYGQSIAADVFINGYDRLSDGVVFGTNILLDSANALGLVPDYVEGRFLSLVNAKNSFYSGEHNMFASDFTGSISQFFGASTAYILGQHRGGDVAGPHGTPIYAGFDGRLVRKGDIGTSSGNNVILEYGFQFENTFYSTGIQGQYMHLTQDSNIPVAINSYVARDQMIGKMGNTGYVVSSNPNSDYPGTHLHYQLMGNITAGENSNNWNMYDYRRNVFLSQVSAPSASSYVANEGTNWLNNYSGTGYYNYFYNVNNYLLGQIN